jgi:hypothetical protein
MKVILMNSFSTTNVTKERVGEVHTWAVVWTAAAAAAVLGLMCMLAVCSKMQQVQLAMVV